MKILLIAKPWKGGLARYVFRALQDLYPGVVEWVATYPETGIDRFKYLLDKKKWKQQLVGRLRRQDYNAAIFINFLPEFKELEYRDSNILWMTDGSTPPSEHFKPFGRIYLSDQGYEAEIMSVIGLDRYGGVLPFACLPQLHQPHHSAKPLKDLCFIGNRDDKRDGPLATLFAAGLAPTVYGNYFLHHPLFWQYPAHFRPAIANDKMGFVYAHHRLALNIHAGVVREGTNMRTFESAAYGIPQLIEHRPGIENYFEPEKEFVSYRSTEELIDRCQMLLTNGQQSKRMAERAGKRVLAEHTYQHRVKTMLKEVI